VTDAHIVRGRAIQVVVPAKPDTLNSPEVDDTDAAFAAKFNTGKSWQDFANSPKWIVELEAADGTIGAGETYRNAERAEVEAALQAVMGKDARALDWRRLPVSNMRVYDAIESAVMDLAGKAMGVPVHQLLGGAVRKEVEVSGWTGRRTPEDAARKAKEALDRGHRVFKFKCAGEDPFLAWSEKVMEACGTDIKLILDPNQRWKDVATTLTMMEGVPPECMECLEDPIERDDYAGFKELRAKLGVPIFIHISVPYRHQGQRPEDLITAIRRDCADGYNFNGPMFDFVKLAAAAELEGKTCWHGSEVDLGLLEAGAVHAAAVAAHCTVPSDVFAEYVREDDLITPGLELSEGRIKVPQGPGLGVELDREALARYATGEKIVVF
jgi:muconate cycloisomerase